MTIEYVFYLFFLFLKLSLTSNVIHAQILSSQIIGFSLGTRWAPTSCKWSYSITPIKWPSKWVPVFLFTSISGTVFCGITFGALPWLYILEEFYHAPQKTESGCRTLATLVAPIAVRTWSEWF